MTLAMLLSTLLSVGIYVAETVIASTSDANRQKMSDLAHKLQSRADTASFEYQNMLSQLSNLFYQAKDHANRGAELKHYKGKYQEAIDKRKEAQEYQREASAAQTGMAASSITKKDVDDMQKAIESRLGGSING